MRQIVLQQVLALSALEQPSGDAFVSHDFNSPRPERKLTPTRDRSLGNAT